MSEASEAQKLFVGIPDCKLRRFTKPGHRASFFCKTCGLLTRNNLCPFGMSNPVMNQKRLAIYNGGTRHTFKVGQRVRPSAYGIERNIFSGTYRGLKNSEQAGVVIKVDEFGCPTVKWSGKKKPQSYYYGFIDIDRRRKP